MAGEDQRQSPPLEPDRIGEYWDALVQHRSPRESIDPSLAAAIEQFQRLTTTPPPSFTFVTRLREDLMESTVAQDSPRSPVFDHLAPRRPGWLPVFADAPARRPRREHAGWLATAALVLLALVLSAAVLVPGARNPRSGLWGGFPMVALDATPPAVSAPAERQTLAEVRVPAGWLPAGRALLWMQVYGIEPGEGGDYPGQPAHVTNLALFGVRSGTMAIAATGNGLGSGGPLQVFRGSVASGTPSTGNPNEVVLVPGDAVLLSVDPGTNYAIRNPGPEPLEFIEAVVFGAGERNSQQPPPNFNLLRYSIDRYIDIPFAAEPVLKLERVPLAPDERIPAPDPTAAQLALSRDGFFEQRTDGSARNITDTLLNVYLFTLEVAKSAATPTP